MVLILESGGILVNGFVKESRNGDKRVVCSAIICFDFAFFLLGEGRKLNAIP